MRHRIAKASRIAAIVAVACGGLAPPVGAEEGGSGHCGTGSMVALIHALPGVPGAWGVVDLLAHYHGGATQVMPLANCRQCVSA